MPDTPAGVCGVPLPHLVTISISLAGTHALLALQQPKKRDDWDLIYPAKLKEWMRTVCLARMRKGFALSRWTRLLPDDVVKVRASNRLLCLLR